MLNTSNYDPLRGFLLDGTAAHVNMGWLQTPDEFARDCLSMVQRPQFGSWSISTQLPDEMVRRLQSPLIPNSANFMVMASKLGILYPVVTLQSAGLQFRFLLSLGSPTTQNWLRAVTSERVIHISLEIPEMNQVAVVSVPCHMQDRSEIETMIRQCADVERDVFLRDAANAARHFADLDAIPSLHSSFKTQDLRLVLVLERGPDHDASALETKARVLN